MRKSDNQSYVIIILTVLFVAAAILSFSCKVTKDIEQEVQTTSVVTKVNVDSIVKVKVDSVAKHYQELIKTLDADIIFNDPEHDTVFIQGKERIVNKVEYVPGKGFNVSGDIKSFKLKESELLKKLDEISLDREMETNLRMSLEDSVKAYKFLLSKEVERKTKNLLWWGMLIGAAVVLFIYNRKKIISLFKKVI